MDDPWEILERAGVPCGALRRAKPELRDVRSVVAATRVALDDIESLDERRRVSLLAWLEAWATSFPTSFHGAFDGEGDAILARASQGDVDVGRYLKLRRIVREQLLRVL